MIQKAKKQVNFSTALKLEDSNTVTRKLLTNSLYTDPYKSPDESASDAKRITSLNCCARFHYLLGISVDKINHFL